MSVDPTGRDLKRFLSEDPDRPVVMLNLLRFKDHEEARRGYKEYVRLIRPFLDDLGATVVYAGDCSTALVAPSDHDWDAVLMVRYPSRAVFCQMVANPKYQEITSLRTEALEEAVLQATAPWDGEG